MVNLSSVSRTVIAPHIGGKWRAGVPEGGKSLEKIVGHVFKIKYAVFDIKPTSLNFHLR